MELTLCTAGGEQHGLIQTLPNSCKENGFKHYSAEMKTKLEKERKEDSRMVKARYINHRGRHERLTKPYCKYAGDPIKIYHLIPEQVYELPMGMIKEVNEACLNVRPKEEGDRDNVNKVSGQIKLHELVPVW